ncbi:hypothetical protein [Bacillus sp. NPDC094106]|uniref:hypothetical protein n=1 Tax=Bacillus sp. NPDC094106 TaxID=3363949 RepID=UPI0037F8E9D9
MLSEIIKEFSNHQQDKILYEKKVYDSQQFLMNTMDKLIEMETEYKALRNCINKIEKERDIWRKKLFEKKIKKMSVNEMFGEDQEYFGVALPLYSVIHRIVSSFFHKAHCYFDCMAQYINTAILGNFALERDGISFFRLLSHLNYNYKKQYKMIIKKMRQICKSRNFNYVSDFNNTTKHIHDISTIITFDITGLEISFTIPSFSKYNHKLRKTNHYEEQDIVKKLQEILIDFVQIGKEVFALVKEEVSKIKTGFISNRIHHLEYQIIEVKESNEVQQFIVYRANKEIQENEEFWILHCKDRGFDINASNCSYDEIIIWDSNNEIIGFLESIEPMDNNGFNLFFYRKYKANLEINAMKIYNHGQKERKIKLSLMDGALVGMK